MFKNRLFVAIEAHLDGNDLAWMIINVDTIIPGVHDYIHKMMRTMPGRSCCVNICLIYDVYPIPCGENQKDQSGVYLFIV